MKHFAAILLLWALMPCLSLAQVPDSSFGEPTSYIGLPDVFVPAITGCEFNGREDRCFAALFPQSGKIILAGYTEGPDGTDLALVRLLSDGRFDTLAGPEGQMRIDLGYPNDSCLAAVLYGTSGLIAVGGCARPPGQDGLVLLVARVDSDGRPDTTFGNNGHVLVDLPTKNEMVTKMVALPDGRLLLAGNAFFGNEYWYPDSTAAFVGRLLPDGRVDSSFGTNGFLYQRYEYRCKASLLSALVLDQQGRIVLSGASYSPYPNYFNYDQECTHLMRVYRYLPDGQPDPSFGVEGVSVLPFSKGRVNAIHIAEDGRILIAGIIGNGIVQDLFTFVARLLPDGSPDVSFNGDGLYRDELYAISGLTEPVSIVKVEKHYYFGVVDEAGGGHSYFGLMRFTEDGRLDSLFGNGGLFMTKAWLQPGLYEVNQIHADGTQGIYISGYYSKLSQDNMMIAKVRLDKTTTSSDWPERGRLAFGVYPNPSQGGRVGLRLGSPVSEDLLAQVYDMHGRLLLSRTVTVAEGLGVLDLAGLPAGVYALTVVGKQVFGTERVVVGR
ncbi:MAG: T9SS type A sorting domain-containing protein [Saprospiraceae bacterium]